VVISESRIYKRGMPLPARRHAPLPQRQDGPHGRLRLGLLFAALALASCTRDIARPSGRTPTREEAAVLYPRQYEMSLKPWEWHDRERAEWREFMTGRRK